MSSFDEMKDDALRRAGEIKDDIEARADDEKDRFLHDVDEHKEEICKVVAVAVGVTLLVNLICVICRIHHDRRERRHHCFL